MTSNNQNQICNCQETIDSGLADYVFRCISCNREHLISCFESIFETTEDLIYIESECRTCILELFHQRVERELEVQSEEPSSTVSEAETEVVSEGEDRPVLRQLLEQPVQEPLGEDLPPAGVELERCEICTRELWYLTRHEWEILRREFPEDQERALCSDCEEEPSREEQEQFIREMNEL